MSSEVIVAFITGVLGPVSLLYLKNFLDKKKAKPDMVKEALKVSELIVSKMEHAIDNHYNVVIWPEMIEEKDINDMVLSGFSPDEIQDIISKNTFLNLRAKVEFMNWKKV